MLGPDDDPTRDPESRLAPEGSVCNEHPERPALATCPVCHGHACLACWHQAVDRCDTCLVRDPAAAAPPVPWEDRGRNALVRYFATFAAAFGPTRTAPAFARDEVRPALRFALLSFVPVGLLSGVIPYTHRIRFGGEVFGVTVVGSPTGAELAADIAQAAGMGLLVHAVGLLGMTVPYVSLCKSYGQERGRAAALRVSLYRGWLLPMSGLDGLFGGLLAWAVPVTMLGTPESPGIGMYLLVAGALLPVLLHFISLRATARLGAGLSPLPSFAAAIVAFLLMGLSLGITKSLLAPWLPEIAAPI